jgi:hypothetical protein
MKNKNILSKIAIFGVTLIILMGISTACESLEAFQSGAQSTYGAGTGYTYIGDYASQEACRSACVKNGYKSDYLWGYSTKHCQCK